MKERPILFSAPMIRALLDDTKTQTRRVVKPQPIGDSVTHNNDRSIWFGWRCGITDDGWRCPYGVPGDRLWVRETHRVDGWDDGTPYATIRYRADDTQVVHRIGADLDVFAEAVDTRWRKAGADDDDDGNLSFPDGQHEPWRPSIFMPRWASRITLEVTEVRCERLQDISPSDAEAEGIRYEDAHNVETRTVICPLVDQYAALWDSINGVGAWALNPWVWAISFKKVQS